MTNQFDNFLKVLKALDNEQVDYILVGGVAVIIHGIERLTRDIDIFVKMNETNIQKLRNALHSIFNDKSIDEITLEELHKYAVIRFGAPDGFYIDIMARLGEMAVYEDLEYEIIHYQNTKIKIATPETLYELKKETLRLKDKYDAAYLLDLIKAKQAKVSRNAKTDKE